MSTTTTTSTSSSRRKKKATRAKAALAEKEIAAQSQDSPSPTPIIILNPKRKTPAKRTLTEMLSEDQQSNIIAAALTPDDIKASESKTDPQATIDKLRLELEQLRHQPQRRIMHSPEKTQTVSVCVSLKKEYFFAIILFFYHCRFAFSAKISFI